MGTNFANIQVRENGINVVKDSLKEYLRNQESESRDSVFSMFTDSCEYSVGKLTDGWITILHPCIDFGSVEETAMEFSNYFKGTMLAVGFFDDAVFGMSVIKDGNILTTHISGEAEEYCGIRPKIGNIDTMINSLNLNISREKLKAILKIKNVEEQVMELEKALNLNLWIKADWLDDDEELKCKFESV